MDTIHELLISSFKKHVTLDKALRWIILRRLERAGIDLTDAQIDMFTINLGEDNEDGTRTINFEFDLDDEELEGRINAVLDQGEDLPTQEEIGAFDAASNKVLRDVVKSTKDEGAELFVKTWADIAPAQLARQGKEEAKFNKRIDRIWGEALKKLRIMLTVSLEAGQTFNDDYRPLAVKDHDLVFEALIRLHARGCQVGREVLILLTHGLADGALARWRTLHEISIIADFISHHGQDVAERYLLHQHIDNYKGMEQYQKHCRALGMRPYSKKEMGDAQHTYDTLLAKFGLAFRYDYGWAATALGKKSPRFPDIEEDVGLERWRPYVKLAHHHVHATSRGNFYALAIPEDRGMMAAGASIYGLYDPGVQTVYSTTYLLSTLLLSNITLDHVTLIQAVMQVANEVYKAFDDALDISEASTKQ